ncbi:MAG: BolA family transcriptional regulator [Betaproteobacteria bacterium]|nr:BolA family transcriptional regulator [Betaproteobacteria bacterium]
MNTMDTMRDRLQPLQALSIEIIDDSAMHAGHAGAKSGGGHYRLNIVSPLFAGLRTIQRHRMIYEALGALMQREVHALSITALAPGDTPE